VTAFLRHFRALAGRYALALALCQVAVLCSATIVLAATPRAGGTTVGAEDECNCEHSTAVMCPMHRKSSSRPLPANTPRWCKGVDGSTYAVLPVLGALALPERVARLLLPLLESPAAAVSAEAPRPLARPPDSPPPRA
jgi:hypothetical protein